MKKRYLALPITLSFCLSMIFSGAQQTPAAELDLIGDADFSFLPQEPPPLVPGSDIHFERYSADQGLSMSVVNSIAQDPDGYLWFATQDGLNRFDGKNFTILKHDPDNPGSLSANWIEVLFMDSTGILWVGTEGGGLDRYDPVKGTFTHFQHQKDDPASIKDNSVYSIFEDRSGTIWIGTASGLDRFDRRSGKFNHLNDSSSPEIIREGIVNSIEQDNKGNLWFGTKEGLIKLQSSNHIYSQYQNDPDRPGSLQDNAVSVIYKDRQGNLWIGTDKAGLLLLSEDGRKFNQVVLTEKKIEQDDQTGERITSILEDPYGRMLIGTWGSGLFYLDPSNGKSEQFLFELSSRTSLSSDNIQAIFRDRSGSVWIGTFGGSLSKFDLSALNFAHYAKKINGDNSLNSNIVWSIYENNGTIWVGTDSGLDRIDRSTGSFTHFTNDPADPESLPSNHVQAIFQDRSGNYWFGTGGGGLSRLDPEGNTFKNYPENPDDSTSLLSGKITSIVEDQHAGLWIGTRNGLSKYNPETDNFTNYIEISEDPSTLNSSDINAIHLSRNGRLWIATDVGLNLFDPDTGKANRLVIPGENQSETSEINILTILEDEDNILWLGTVGRGMIRFDPATRESNFYYEKNGLPNDTVYGILQDKSGFLWMSTNDGLGRFDPKNELFEVFDAKDGLQGNEFNSYAYFKNLAGEMFFGGINGFSVFNPQAIQPNTYIPPISLVAITTNGQDLLEPLPADAIEQTILKWPVNSFEFEFAGLSFVQAEQNQYAYYLENFDKGWNYNGTNSFGRYTNLPGGDYILRLKASNNDGVWNEEGRAIKIKVVPPFWQTIWFKIGLALTGLMLVFLGYRLRVYSVLNRSKKLENLVQERTKEIEHRRQELEALYRADEALYKNLQVEQVLEALVGSAIKLLKADKGSLLVLDKEKNRLKAQVTHGFQADTMPLLDLEFGEGIAGQVAKTGEPILVQDVENEPRVARRIVEAEGIRSMMQVPIKVGGEVFGVFSADFTQTHTFTEDELRLLMSLAQRAAQAIQNAQIYEQTQEQAIAEERNRLARELHDAVTQSLFSASLIAEALPTAFNSNPNEGLELLSELRQLNRGALAEMRALLMELRPSALAEANLEDLLRQLGEAAAGREGIPINIQTNGHRDLPPDVHIALYRIAQEALNNALKHARAKHISIKLATNFPVTNNNKTEIRHGIQLMICDDGRGFDPHNVPSDHLGLNIMRERAQSIDAQLTIDSKAGKGTQVTVLWENNYYN